MGMATASISFSISLSVSVSLVMSLSRHLSCSIYFSFMRERQSARQTDRDKDDKHGLLLVLRCKLRGMVHLSNSEGFTWSRFYCLGQGWDDGRHATLNNGCIGLAGEHGCNWLLDLVDYMVHPLNLISKHLYLINLV